MKKNNLIEKYSIRGTNPYRLDSLLMFAGNKILDYGCGSGAYIKSLYKNKDIYGVDVNKFNEWSFEPNRFKKIKPNQTGYENNSFDTVSCFEVLEHCKDPEKTLSEIHRICRNNLILTVPDCDISEGFKQSNLLYSHWSDPTHVNFFNKESLTTLLLNNGFKVDLIKSINPINLMPAVLEYLNIGSGKKNIITKILNFLINKFKKRKYYITILVVAIKVNK